MKCLLLFGFIAIAFAAKSDTELGRQCNAPDNGGLNGIIDNTKSLFDENAIMAVVIEYATNDAQMRCIFEFLQSPEFEKMLRVLEKQDAFISLVETACKKLYLDVIYYINKTAIRTGLPKINIPKRFRSADQKTGGLIEMFKSIAEILPKEEELKKVFEDTLKKDKYLQEALKFISSEDFNEKITTLTSLKEYTVFLDKIKSFGVNVEEIKAYINDVYEKLGSYVKKP